MQKSFNSARQTNLTYRLCFQFLLIGNRNSHQIFGEYNTSLQMLKTQNLDVLFKRSKDEYS